MNMRIAAPAAALTLLAALAFAGEEPVTPAAQAALAEALSPSLARVEYTLTMDKGDEPEGHGWSKRCPNCGSYHGGGAGGNLIRDQRPLELGGFAVAANQVIIPDPLIHPRFVKAIAVRQGDQTVGARVAGYFRDQNALLLETAGPLKEAKALAFEAGKPGPYFAVGHGRENGVWQTTVQPLAGNVAVSGGRKFLAAPSSCLIVDRAGTPVALVMKEELPLDDSWKGSPLKWAMLSTEEMTGQLTELEKRAGAGLLRVKLNFRSPKKDSGGRFRMRSDDEDGENATERNVTGVLLDAKKVLVLAEMRPAVTARLERIRVYPAGGGAVAARFAGTFTDYGALLAEAERPLEGAVALSAGSILDCQNALLLAAQIIPQGDKRVERFVHARFPAVELGWKNRPYPEVPGRDGATFLFDLKGELVVMPVSRREPVSLEDRGWRGGREGSPTPTAYVREALAEGARALDAGNVPLKKEEENRLAWMGLMLQPLDKELARINNVSELTRDGQTGALVSYVYPGSPAETAGIKAGAVLLRLHLKDQPKPLEIRLDAYGDPFGGEPFPWDQLDKIPDQYYDQLPKPWPAVEDSLTRALTDLGFGKPYTAEFFAGGKTLMADLVVTAAPAHYDSAPRWKSEALGLTARDLTFEVRRYFQMKPEDPGVIVSNLKPGSKAAVAGIRPYEIIVQVNGQPVATVKDLEKLCDKQEELRLAVKRQARERQVKIKLTGPTPPAPKPEPEDAEGQ